ncbi:hypothetical protein [Sinorhizobium sp. RAC02]|uniref:hypothetical protein n=1 Tax=Sinorhizobium sp. RAC02 TaxID=1842534 RepID=UPI00123709D6|nr:hypothetical protein [Sinorhizobium sp. RAC02]
MGIFGKLLEMVERYRQARAEREALRLLIARKDVRLLRDAGLGLPEDAEPRCTPLPQTKERRWTAPLFRLPPPSPRNRGEGDTTPASSNKKPRKHGKHLGLLPSPRLRGEGDRQAG